RTLWPGHPLGRPILGTRERIRASTRGSVRGFYRRHYVPGRLVVAAAGNVRHEHLVRMLTDRMEAGREVSARGRSTWRLRDAPRPPKPSGDQHVQRKKTEQAHIVVGTNGLSRSDPERFAFLIVNTALGGGMSSRLFQEIREKRGLAYTAYSFHSQFAEVGLFSAYAGTTPGKAREVCRAVDAADDLTLIAVVDPHHEGTELGNLVVAGSPDALEGVDVAVDFTTPRSVMENARSCLGRGMHMVIGTTGIHEDGLEEIRRLAGSGNANAIVAPNFAIGAALMMRFAEQAARHFDAAEVIELHHDQKVDAPSGTAITTAQRIGAVRAGAWEAPGGDASHPGARGADVGGIG